MRRDGQQQGLGAQVLRHTLDGVQQASRTLAIVNRLSKKTN